MGKDAKHVICLPVSKPTVGAAGKTGTWRIFRPVVATDKKCLGCRMCWVFCPEGCIEIADGNLVSINLEYCKGCGICAKECRLGVLRMQREET